MARRRASEETRHTKFNPPSTHTHHFLGDLESAPVFVRASYDLGTHEFVWRTAAACVQASKTGSGCKVFDDDLGETPHLMNSA